MRTIFGTPYLLTISFKNQVLIVLLSLFGIGYISVYLLKSSIHIIRYLLLPFLFGNGFITYSSYLEVFYLFS